MVPKGVKREYKDSVFCTLFRIARYQRELFELIHPEEKDLAESDFQTVTIEQNLTYGNHNDTGFAVRDKVIALAEAQSTPPTNLPARLLTYLGSTYAWYIGYKNIDIYSSTLKKLPRPELYVIYTGTAPLSSDVLRFSDCYDGEKRVELIVKVIPREPKGSIVDQYTRFCEIGREVAEQVEVLHEGDLPEEEQRKAFIREVLRRCKEEDVLTQFLLEHGQEVADCMDNALYWESVQNRLREEGLERGREEGTISSYAGLVNAKLLKLADAVAQLNMPVEQFTAKAAEYGCPLN